MQNLTPTPSAQPCPKWFGLFDIENHIPLRAARPADRFEELINLLGRLETRIYRGSTVNRAAKRFWHNPNPGWPSELWKKKGGWFRCRSGDEATAAERSCPICPAQPEWEEDSDFNGITGTTYQDKYDWLIRKIDKARAEALEADKARIIAQLRAEESMIGFSQPQVDWRVNGELSCEDVGMW